MFLKLYVPDGNRDNIKSVLKDVLDELREFIDYDEQIMNDTRELLTSIVNEISKRNKEEHII